MQQNNGEATVKELEQMEGIIESIKSWFSFDVSFLGLAFMAWLAFMIPTFISVIRQNNLAYVLPKNLFLSIVAFANFFIPFGLIIYLVLIPDVYRAALSNNESKQ